MGLSTTKDDTVVGTHKGVVVAERTEIGGLCRECLDLAFAKDVICLVDGEKPIDRINALMLDPVRKQT